jgi:TonB family protein
MDDAIKTVKPEYGYTERAHRLGGFGLYRVTLDLKTGAVTKVTVMESTGVPVLDDNATKALRQWLWKPGRWKEVDVPIAFLQFNR